MNNDRKLIVFKKDIENDNLSNKEFVKFLDNNKKYAIFYMPLIAPKNFKSYLKENEILEAYEILNEDNLNKYEDYIYTFRKDNGVYDVIKGIELVKKKVMLVDNGMDICLNLPKYYYDIDGPFINIEQIKKTNYCKDYCYVEEPSKINSELSKLMIDVTEAVPGILRIDSCYEKGRQCVKNKGRKRPK